jgi:Na+-transporting methylmalonyl-CoA/oxaloacetate decarboxylase gamma subunit
MRAIFSVLSLLIVLTIVGALAKRQLGALPVVTTQNPAAANAGVTLPITSPGATPQAQSQQIQQQIKQSVEAAIQQPRPMPEEP